MSTLRNRVVWLVLLALVLAASRPGELQAQSAATFTVTVKSAYLRAQPSPTAMPLYSVFEGATYPITGRTADNTWVSLAFAGATGGTWIRADFGSIDGGLAAVPVSAAGAAPAAATQAPSAARPAVVQSSGGTAVMQLTITVNSTYVRDAPDWQSNRIASLFKNQVVRVGGRDGSGEWLQVVGTGWVPAGVGTLSGKIINLPVVGAVNRPASASVAGVSAPTVLPDWIPSITPGMKAKFRQIARNGLDPRFFTVVGDCNSEGYRYLHPLALGHIDFSEHGYLAGVLETYKSSFYRNSVAVSGGFNTASVLDPLWAHPGYCEPGETPFACELRVSKAGVVFILLGTGDQFTWQTAEANYREMIEHALETGAVPVMVTKADRLESEEGGAEVDYLNDLIRRLALEYDVPLFDMNVGTRVLENRGLLDETGHDFHLSAEGIWVHILGTLQMLYFLSQP